jgi:hypothetical protein
MFELVSDEVRLETLLKVVRNLIVNSRNAEIFRLSEILREEQVQTGTAPLVTKEEIKQIIKEEIKEKVKEKLSPPLKKEIKKENLKDSSFIPGRPIMEPPVVPPRRPTNFGVKRVLKIPKVTLPPYLSNIKPVATNKVSIDLGKLNPFVDDPNVSSLETEGENEPVYVSGSMGRRPTSVKLSRVEIDEVINRFSEMSKIPKKNGMFRVAVGKLLITAMISDSVSPRFVIERMKPDLQAPPGPGFK